MFIILAFAGTLAGADLTELILTQWIVKVLYETAATPLTYLVVAYLKRKEGIDTLTARCRSISWTCDKNSLSFPELRNLKVQEPSHTARNTRPVLGFRLFLVALLLWQYTLLCGTLSWGSRHLSLVGVFKHLV